MSACASPIDVARLVDYWLGDADAAANDAIDEHLLGCDSCGATLDALIALGHGVRAAFDAGLVGTVVSAAFIDRLAERGLRVREYRVPNHGSVECSVAPDDDFVVSRLQASLAGVTRLDAVSRSAAGEERRRDVPFDAARDELLIAPKVSRLRGLPASRLDLELIAVDAGGVERSIGRYTLNHHPWPHAGRL